MKSLGKNFLKLFFITGTTVILTAILSSFLFVPFYFSSSIVIFVLFVFIYNLLESPFSGEGIYVAFLTGLIIDIFASAPFFGVYTAIFLALSYFLKFVLKKYVGLPAFS